MSFYKYLVIFIYNNKLFEISYEIVSFVNYFSEINKTLIIFLKLHKVNQFTPSVKFFC